MPADNVEEKCRDARVQTERLRRMSKKLGKCFELHRKIFGQDHVCVSVRKLEALAIQLQTNISHEESGNKRARLAAWELFAD